MGDCQALLIEDNKDIKTAIKIVSEELYMTGYPTLPSYDQSRNGDDYLILPLLNTVWALIKQRKKYITEKRDVDHNKMFLEVNIKSLEKNVSDLEDNKKIMKNDFKRLINELEVVKRKNGQTLKELNESKVENKKLQKLLQSRNEEYCNKVRQKEHEIIELQKILLQKIEVRRKCENIPGNTAEVEINSVFNEKMRQIEKMNKRSICKLENTIQTLVQENINLRNSLEAFVKKLCQLKVILTGCVNEGLPPSLGDSPSDSSLSDSNEVGMRHLFNLPGDNIINYVEEFVTRIIKKIIESQKKI